jgi:hypothetical protein
MATEIVSLSPEEMGIVDLATEPTFIVSGYKSSLTNKKDKNGSFWNFTMFIDFLPGFEVGMSREDIEKSLLGGDSYIIGNRIFKPEKGGGWSVYDKEYGFVFFTTMISKIIQVMETYCKYWNY